MSLPRRQVRALHTAETITVYQAYGPQIGRPALANGRFVDPFRRDRMTWIKPSFRWMMYRCGWGTEPGQEVVLAVEISRAGFEWALEHACLSHYDRDRYPSRQDWSRQLRRTPVRVQWDPDRSLDLRPLPHRCIQVGLSGTAVDRYVDDWTVRISDVTATARTIHEMVRAGDRAGAEAMLPEERPYPLPERIAAGIGASPAG